MSCSSISLPAPSWMILLLLWPGMSRFPCPSLHTPLGHPAGHCPPWLWRMDDLLTKESPGVYKGP